MGQISHAAVAPSFQSRPLDVVAFVSPAPLEQDGVLPLGRVRGAVRGHRGLLRGLCGLGRGRETGGGVHVLAAAVAEVPKVRGIQLAISYFVALIHHC